MCCVLVMGYLRWKYCLQGFKIEINDESVNNQNIKDNIYRIRWLNGTLPSKLLLLSIIEIFEEIAKLLSRSFLIGSVSKNSLSRGFTDTNFDFGSCICWKLCKMVLAGTFISWPKTESVILETPFASIFFIKFDKIDLRWSDKNRGTPECIMAPLINFDDLSDSKW